MLFCLEFKILANKLVCPDATGPTIPWQFSSGTPVLDAVDHAAHHDPPHGDPRGGAQHQPELGSFHQGRNSRLFFETCGTLQKRSYPQNLFTASNRFSSIIARYLASPLSLQHDAAATMFYSRDGVRGLMRTVTERGKMIRARHWMFTSV